MRILALHLLFLVTALGGCADRRAWTRADEWYAPIVAYELLPNERRAVPWAEVRPSASSKAQKQLADAQWVRLSPADAAAYLVGDAFGADPHHQLYLVRGLYLNRGTGRFDVTYDGQALFVHHASLGRRARPMKHQPVIVALPGDPKRVFVTVSMAE